MTEDERTVAARQIVRLARCEEWQGFAAWVGAEYDNRVESLLQGNATDENLRYMAGQASMLRAVLELPQYAATWLQLRQEAHDDG